MTRYTEYPATMPMSLYTDSSGDDWMPRLPPDVEPIECSPSIDLADKLIANAGRIALGVAAFSLVASALSWIAAH